MKRLLLPGVLAVAAALVLGGPAEGQSPPSPETPAAAGQTGAAGVDRARALMEAGRFLEALKVLRPLVERHPDRPEVLFLVGLAGIEASRQPDVSEKVRKALLDAAIEALHAMLVQDPSLVRARLEMARAFFLKGKDSLARRHFEQVLAGDLPPAVVANVQRFLIRIRARKRWSVYFGAALAPDSNIGAASDERFIQIHVGGVPLLVPSRSGGAHHLGVGAFALDGRRVPASVGGAGPAPRRWGSLAARVRGVLGTTRPTSACTRARAGSWARGRT